MGNTVTILETRGKNKNNIRITRTMDCLMLQYGDEGADILGRAWRGVYNGSI